jgi:hypothetical protein
MHWSKKHEQDTFNHYVNLAQKPGWLEYVERRIRVLEKRSEQTGFHIGIEAKFLEAMKGKQ